MAKENKKEDMQINEEDMMNLMVDGVKKQGFHFVDEPSQKKEIKRTSEKPRLQKKEIDNYGNRFLTTHSMNKRGDKSIYIRQEYHERLSRIVRVIGEDKIPLYAYLDNILKHHFELFEKTITEDFNKKFKPIF